MAGLKLGFIPANRPIFSQDLAKKMRDETVAVMKEAGIEVVVPEDGQTSIGCVQDIKEADVAAAMFREQDVDGIVIGAVNFGDEQAAAWAVRQSGLSVPIFIFGCQEEAALTVDAARRDSFCGLLSIGDTLRQIGAKYSVGRTPICFPTDESFKQDINWFERVCRVVKGIKTARYGQIGARPEAFWTCRYDEKQLQRLGPTTVVMDLSEVISGANAIKDDDSQLAETLKSLHGYADVSQISDQAVLKNAKLELFLRRWKDENQLNGLAVQCWNSMQANYGICSCTTMSRLGDELCPSACEADIIGTLSMHACQLASGTPAGLADWNNLHNDDENLVNIWHCGVFPKAFAKEQPRLNYHNIMVSAGVDQDKAEGIVELEMKETPVTLCRVTQNAEGGWATLIAEGQIEENSAKTIGSYGWCRIKNLQALYRDVLLRYFPHHVAMTQGEYGTVLWEALGNYLDLPVYHNEQATPGLYTPANPFV